MSKLKNVVARIRSGLLSVIEKNLTEQDRLQLQRNSVFNCFKRLADAGYSPDYIIDVGAHIGTWSIEINKIFSLAKIIAIEPLPGKINELEKNLGKMPVSIYNVLLGPENKQAVEFYSLGTGSSVFKELTHFSTRAQKISVDMLALDYIIVKENAHENILLKIDVQGFEIEVLKGATKTLEGVDFVCMEISFLNYNEGAPLAHEVIPYMKSIGFVIYDIAGFIRKTTDKALIQSDMIFINEKHPIRRKINNLDEEFYVMY